MFTEVGSVPVLVNDAKKAAKWYAEKLGFEVSSQGHWVTAKPKGSKTVIHLCEKCADWEGDSPGGNTGIYLTSDDKTRTYNELKAKDVQFKVELTDAPWAPGKYAILKDLDGNEFWM
ncbi:MAG: VOC family protein [Nitrososphaerota archaeon]|nr:VOC family protein [Nitrososphaerota archaeon]